MEGPAPWTLTDREIIAMKLRHYSSTLTQLKKPGAVVDQRLKNTLLGFLRRAASLTIVLLPYVGEEDKTILDLGSPLNLLSQFEGVFNLFLATIEEEQKKEKNNATLERFVYTHICSLFVYHMAAVTAFAALVESKNEPAATATAAISD